MILGSNSVLLFICFHIYFKVEVEKRDDKLQGEISLFCEQLALWQSSAVL